MYLFECPTYVHVFACDCAWVCVLCVCVCVCVCARARARARVRVYVYAYVSVGGWLGGCCKCGCVLLRLSFVNQEETDKDGGEYVVFNICLLI